MGQISIFDTANTDNQPLAARMRPRNFDEFVGQQHLVGEGKVLRNLIEKTVVRRHGGSAMADELGLPVSEGNIMLPCGASGRWQR